MKSMTGFGTGEAALAGGRLFVDARSVNHRFLEVRTRLPTDLVDQTTFLEQRARERLSRGRFDITVRYEGPLPVPKLDLERARMLYRGLTELRDAIAPGSDVPFAALLSLPGLYGAPGSFENGAVQASLERALDSALSALETMRTREGLALQKDLKVRLETCQGLCAKVLARLPEAVRGYETRLRARIARLTNEAGPTLEPGRLEAEVALLVDRTDVAEELVRLSSHFDQFEALLEAKDPAGRRMDFLLQEMARESNTIGAKCQDAELSHLVVELKSEIERMREQVQNVE